jgi:ADP-ribose pyrophosphatase YjhB (NUDIX family)
MVRLSVKLLLLDEENHVLLIHAKDPHTREECWYPVGGGVELGETLQQAASREAREETGLKALPEGSPVWTRDHTYRFNGRVMEVHEEWLLHSVQRFDPAPAHLSDYEARSILGFRWWRVEDLMQTADTVYPPRLGQRLSTLLQDGIPPVQIDITEDARLDNR